VIQPVILRLLRLQNRILPAPIECYWCHKNTSCFGGGKVVGFTV